MDTTAERAKLEDTKRSIEAYLEHPISRRIIEDNKVEQEKAIVVLTNVSVDSIEAFFNHFEAVGHLRGLRRAMSIVMDEIEQIERELKELPNE